ncbi:Holliday junction branch migration protein RuvA [Mammaliicoccus stepanovicii]|uniref:Holliday junction branch migration complex subunit RuvA n=1 Tax=Mammaliicoccus stepanovicii TaxID=643214 RepID=A0A239Z312_9STAP|nr:Holliday junction branch migration protein RuvA [Mammaliicoccus stepanovicii]PNZ72388.1 Holliday junction branch migration protein RuvA [Mammaliicoccus stepanovicii]GGI40219.1 Holliday junction ATP-dependent DNA helicase RuvA [Mammaliicoccus stepanovicii]SNV65377.1 Holliday junction DNA helicase RuvA [Mammaliicoccus stepanovicii]
MYAYIKGSITAIYPSHIVIERGGIGYEIQTPNSYRFQAQLEQEAIVYTQLIVREDAQLLYGFNNLEEKDMFLNLIKVTGIGPKSALAILAASTPNEVTMAIENENETYLTKFPGIGKKTARQIILDLKGKLVVSDESDLFVQNNDSNKDVLEEALLALEALGYSKREITKVKKTLDKESFDTVDACIKRGLALLIQ